jgi:hypothetical protein
MIPNGDQYILVAPAYQWLISSPKFSQVVIGEDGYPASLVVPDPRAFALHKLWLSEQSDREPVKGLAVAQLIIQYLPQYQFNTSELRMFPKDVVQKPVRHRLRLQVCRMGN